MLKKLHIVFLLAFMVGALPMEASAEDKNIAREFMISFIEGKEESPYDTYLADGVVVPEIREHTRVKGYSSLSSPLKNTKVVIGYFEDDLADDRMAFIWELTVEDDKITNIRVVHDGSNPMINEEKTVKEYEELNGTSILVPSDLPFTITHVDGAVNDDQLEITYKNGLLNDLLSINVGPKTYDIDNYSGDGYESLHLSDGTKVLFYSGEAASEQQLIFQKSNLQYTIRLNTHSSETYDIIKVVESM
ncbi:hypothetical protein [Evansella cellulosilytica]|uniref:Uncharacterized protein n=1 Tax=Evansella cellulosilytica (strain ATCC 21833 / DSM 2522 / FERM P-1141 / JCM 9156 / N-4) TaxID=649639 RepID=E6TWF5_EVAC2|nr:hypothetical protein [Evansella cellulosilytica]ADU32218.1 hypothetical protein Bcell_3986 [Evansella cellulosilytica DSM 2522]